MNAKKIKQLDNYYRRKYNITWEHRQQMLKGQNGACAICKKSEKKFKKRLSVDHNHKTGVIRGLLCYYCNKFIVGRHNFVSSLKLYLYMAKYDI